MMGLLENGGKTCLLFDENNGLSFYVFGCHGKEGSWEDEKLGR
jgi:hypothetical protein